MHCFWLGAVSTYFEAPILKYLEPWVDDPISAIGSWYMRLYHLWIGAVLYMKRSKSAAMPV